MKRRMVMLLLVVAAACNAWALTEPANGSVWSFHSSFDGVVILGFLGFQQWRRRGRSPQVTE